jgi:N-acetylglutamate synthase-like GNAT family acetyltransferase
MEFRRVTHEDLEEVRQLLIDCGWETRVSDKRRFETMVERAGRTIAAFDDGRLVGFARALCDESSNGYIGTVAVVESHRGRGIGREMVQKLIGDDPNITWVLRSGRGSDGFWEKLGFKRSEVAMEKIRSI